VVKKKKSRGLYSKLIKKYGGSSEDIKKIAEKEESIEKGLKDLDKAWDDYIKSTGGPPPEKAF